MNIKIVPTELWEEMREYLSEDAILVPEPELQGMTKKNRDLILKNVGKHIDYDFGGEPDIRVDIVDNDMHYVFDALSNRDKDV